MAKQPISIRPSSAPFSEPAPADNLQVEDIMVKPKWANNMTFKDKNGNEITRTELPSNLKTCQCENC